MIKLRKAQTIDEDDIFQLVKNVLSEYGLNIDQDNTDLDISDLQAYYFENNGWFSVLVDKNKIIGSYGIYQINQSTCELRKMYLLTESHGKGYGKLMMEDALIKAKSLGYTEMVLETNQLLDKAVGLYRRYGFIEVSADHLSDRCDLAMRRQLY